MNAIKKAEGDIQRGDYGSARRRIESYIMVKGYDAELMAKLGQISFEMRDLFNAGRHWLVSTAEGEHVERAIQNFIESAGKHPNQIASEVLRAARLSSIEKYPALVQERLRRLGLAVAIIAAAKKPVPAREQLGLLGKVIVTLCVILFVGFICIFGVGLQVIIRWLGD